MAPGRLGFADGENFRPLALGLGGTVIFSLDATGVELKPAHMEMCRAVPGAGW